MDFTGIEGTMDAHDLTKVLWQRAAAEGVTSASAFMDLMERHCGGKHQAMAAVGWTYTGFLMDKVPAKDVEQAWQEFLERKK